MRKRRLMDATDVAQDRNQLSAANRVVVDREAVLRDLLRALKECVDELSAWNPYEPCLEPARAAIAQAEGRT